MTASELVRQFFLLVQQGVKQDVGTQASYG